MPPRLHTTCPWLRGWRCRPRHRPVFWSSEKIERTVARLFRARWVPMRDFHKVPLLGDSEYYLPPLDEAVTVINNSHVNAKQYAKFRFDCEDFAYVLKAHFSQAAYRKKCRRFAYCFGLIWGEELWTGRENAPHAMNWMITSDGVFRLVEPQTAEFRELQPAATGDRRVYLMTA